MALKKLHRRHKEFIAHYVETKNASEAARRSGYKHSNARNTSCLLLQDPKIKHAVSNMFKQKDISCERILAEYVAILEADDAKHIDKRGVLDSLAKIKGLMRDRETVVNNNFAENVTKLAEKRRIFDEEPSNN